MRFTTAYLASTPGEHTITGTERMQNRPIRILVDALRYLGADITYVRNEGYPPLHIKGKALEGGHLEVVGNISSQYISALLMIGPMLKKGLELKLTGEIASRPYIDLTLWTMKEYGADACTMNTLMNYDNSLFDDPQSHTLVTRDDAFDELWTDRPALPHGAIDVQDEATAGETAKSKLKRLAFELSKKDSCQDDIFFFNSLDDIAWVLNLRGNDIAYNPVFLAFMTYSRVLECYTLYAHTDALTPAARQHLEKLNVGVIDYEDKENLSFALRDPRTRFTHNAPAGLIPTTNTLPQYHFSNFQIPQKIY